MELLRIERQQLNFQKRIAPNNFRTSWNTSGYIVFHTYIASASATFWRDWTLSKRVSILFSFKTDSAVLDTILALFEPSLNNRVAKKIGNG